jgi:hypothetical protein
MAWARLTKEVLDKKTGLSLARYMKGLGAKITKLITQMETSPTKKRAEALDDLEKHMAELTKSKVTTGSRPSGSKTPPAQTGSRSPAAIKKRIQELDERAAKTRGKKVSRKRTEAIKQKEAAKNLKNSVKQGLGGSGGARQRTLTPEGQKLWDEDTEDSLRKLAKNLKEYSYPGGRQAPKSKIEGSIPQQDMPVHELIEDALGRDVQLTKQQVQDAMGGKLTQNELQDIIQDQVEERVSKADMAKAFEAAGFQVKSSGFNKGGYKKFQGRSKLGSKEHTYVGGGSVSEISHFRKKKKS